MRILKNFCIGCISVYRYTLAPLFMSLGVTCRFDPSCSEFARRSLEMHGLWRGSALAIGRVMRCHPFAKGGLDPVPGEKTLELRNG